MTASTVSQLSWTSDRARIAALSRSRSKDDPDLLDARRSLAANHLAVYIKRTVDAAPPLTDDQREQLVRLLQPGLSISGGSDAA